MKERFLKVMCKTCKGVHSYKDPDVSKAKAKAKAKPKSAAGKKASDRKSSSKSKDTYDQAAIEAAAAKGTKEYQMSSTFQVGDIIAHPKFGLGLVKEATKGNVVVSFKGGKKLLVHDYLD